MKSFPKLLAVAVALVASTVVARAQVTGGVTFSGDNTYSPDQVIFTSDGNINPASATGTFAAVVGSSTAVSNLQDFTFTPNGTTSASGTIFQISGADGDTIYFTGISVSDTSTTNGMGIDYEDATVTGDFTEDNSMGVVIESATAGTFGVDTQYDSISGTTATTFSASAGVLAPTPEPSSLLLLGTGLLGSAGMLYRRKHINSAI